MQSRSSPLLAKSAWMAAASICMLSACSSEPANGGGRQGGPGGRPPAAVTLAVVEPRQFIDRIEAVGTANAMEAVTISASVTERIQSLSIRDGANVSKGQVLAILAQGEEAALLAEGRAQLRETSAQLSRLQQLADKGFATRAQIDQQTGLRDSAIAAVDTAQARIADRVIRAPFSGVVGLRQVSEGLIVQAGTPIITLSDISRIKLDFTVPEVFLNGLAPGQTITARAAAYPGEVFTGRVDSIDPQVDPITRAVAVRAVLPNGQRRLKPGMLMLTNLTSKPRTSLTVPEQALAPRLDQQFVYVYDPKTEIVQERRLQTGSRQPGFVEVISGLTAGEQVVVEGTLKISDGDKVRAITSTEKKQASADLVKAKSATSVQ